LQAIARFVDHSTRINEHRIHQIFQVSVLLKGAHALIECVGGIALALISTSTITDLVNRLIQEELIEDPKDFVATHLLGWAQSFSVGEHEIRHTSKGLNVEGNVGDDVLIELIARAAERFQGSLAAYGPAEFQRRVARVAGANHLAVSFEDPELEKARVAAQAATPAPVNKAALECITERNSKRDRLPDIPFHRLWQPGDAGELTFVGLRVVDQQNLLIASNGTENVVLPITPEQRHHLAQHQRGITLTISSAVTIQAHVQGLER
jgi:hypothetical protein